MNSLNHYAYGSVADWMYRYMCGFHPHMAEAVRMTIRPMPDERFTYVKGCFKSVFGTYRSEWRRRAEGGFEYEIEVPFNASAEIIFPDGRKHIVECGIYRFDN